MPRSNDMGRAYEFALCNQIIDNFKNVYLTNRTEAEQQRDAEHFNSLSHNTKIEYIQSAKLVCEKWLIKKIHPAELYTLDRLPDRAGVNGDVTDIRMVSDFDTINISLKHNHDALKHPRLTRIPNWIGLNSDAKYREIHDKIWDDFFVLAKKLNPGATLFRDLIAVDEEFINNYLYNPFCSFITEYLSDNSTSIQAVQNMFDFLVGTYDFYKIIDYRDHIKIQDFINIPKPTSVSIFQTDRSHIAMNFNNGVTLDLRLHTASSRLISSVKFDVRGVFDDIKSFVIYK